MLATLWVAALALIVQWLQPEPLSWRYDRVLVLQGEVWRLLSGTWVHISWAHLVFNLAGLALVLMLFEKVVRPLKLLLLLVAIGGLSHVLLMAYPGLLWVVGLSGALHGLFVHYTLTHTVAHAPRFAFILLAGLGLKLFLEAALGAGASTWLDGHSVAWPSHWTGAATGLATGGIAALANRCRARGSSA